MDQKCCGCFQYRTGVLTLGYLNAILGAIGVIVGSVNISKCADYDKNCSNFYGILLGSYSIATLAGVLLLVGVYKSKPVMFLPYCIIMIINSLYAVGVGIYAFTIGAILAGVVNLLSAGLGAYFAFAVYMYKRILTRRNEGVRQTI